MHFRSAEYLVVDTSAFINSVSLHSIGKKVCTIPEVIDEVRNKRQFRHLLSLTHDVEIMTVFSESTAFVTDFAKKTGDYTSLSGTDMKLIALTYQLETQYVGQEHIRKSPVVKQFKTNARVKSDHTTTNNALRLPVNIDNYVRKQDKLNSIESSESDEDDPRLSNSDDCNNFYENEGESSDEQNFHDCETGLDGDNYDTADESLSSDHEDAFNARESENELYTQESRNELDAEKSENELDSEESENSVSENESSDDDTWITPRNVSELKHSAGGTLAEATSVTVGCLTTDFAIQNVLMQMGLNVVTADGKVIKELRTYILRCYACFKTTSNMRKIFCPNCGNKTLKRVSVFLNKDGNKCMYINFKKNISTRGKRFSLPMPKGGKHTVNPRLVEDARRPHQKPSKLARMKTNALEEDYTAGWSPFVMRDIQSKSAQLGFNKGKQVYKYWMRRNPNESKRMPKK